MCFLIFLILFTLLGFFSGFLLFFEFIYHMCYILSDCTLQVGLHHHKNRFVALIAVLLFLFIYWRLGRCMITKSSACLLQLLSSCIRSFLVLIRWPHFQNLLCVTWSASVGTWFAVWSLSICFVFFLISSFYICNLFIYRECWLT